MILVIGTGNFCQKEITLLKNTGAMDGYETVQLYIKDDESSLERPEKELKGFKKLSLEPGTSVDVEFKISIDLLAFYNRQNEYLAETGEFHIWIGSSSEKGLQSSFQFKNR